MSVFIHQRMKVDQITITIKIPALELYLAAGEKFWTLPKVIKEYFPQGRCTVSKSKKTSVVCASIYPEKTQTSRMIAALTLGVTKSGHRYFSLTLYPGKMAQGDFGACKAILDDEVPIFSYDKLYATGRVTRLDLALDILSEHKTALFPYRPKCRVVKVFANGGSTYLGSSISSLMFCIYDKVKQLLETGKPAAPHACITRIEARIRSVGCAPCELEQKLQNPFGVLHVAELQVLRGASVAQDWQTFLDRAEAYGQRVALASLSDAKRKTFSQRLKAHTAWWWKPASFFKELAAALSWLKP